MWSQPAEQFDIFFGRLYSLEALKTDSGVNQNGVCQVGPAEGPRQRGSLCGIEGSMDVTGARLRPGGQAWH